jgi:transcription antitermination factor NusG
MAVAYPHQTGIGTSPDAMQPGSAEPWFALRVRTRWESTTATLLLGRGYGAFLPTYKQPRRWSGRLREVAAPLFPGYVFCSFDVQKRLPVLITPGVIAVVSRGKTPIPVDTSELEAIRAAMRSGLTAQPWPYLEIGERVRVSDEALQGLEGILVNFKGSDRVVLSVSLLRRSVALEIDRSRVSPIRPPRPVHSEMQSSQSLVGEPGF